MYASRRTGAAVVIVVVIVAIVAIAGAGVWYFVLRSTPEKTLQTMFRAQMNGDVETVKACMTERSQIWARNMTGMMGAVPEQDFEYTLGEAEIDGRRATVVVTFPLPEEISRYTGQTEMKVSYALQKENGAWKVDLQDTVSATTRALMGGAAPGRGALR